VAVGRRVEGAGIYGCYAHAGSSKRILAAEGQGSIDPMRQFSGA
jgi:hypothetical protein